MSATMNIVPQFPTRANNFIQVDAHQVHTDTDWLQFFNPVAAFQSVIDHCATLTQTPEQHTLQAYTSGLTAFVKWAGSSFPNASLLREFIAYLRTVKKVTANTINCKYLAPVRHYIRALSHQHITHAVGEDRFFVLDCKDQLRIALDIKNPPGDTTSNLPPIDRHGHYLSLIEVNNVFQAIDPSTKSGLRDLALLYVGFTTGFRLAEIQRMTLSTIAPHNDFYLVRVRGKRSNGDPVPLDADAYRLIMLYVDTYNQGLAEDDPRRITGDTPLWQPLIHGDNYPIIGVNRYDPQKGISHQGIRGLVQRRVAAATHYKNFAPHDMRRTIATISNDSGMDRKHIQKLLRHKSLATTDLYLGDRQDYGKSLISRKITYALPI